MSDDFESKVTEILRSLHNQARADVTAQSQMRKVLEQQVEINKRLISRIDALEVEVELLRKTACASP